jgi:hypothetical protein
MVASGPPYPRYSPGFTPGSNSIGMFQIGISPIGDISPYDPWLSVMNEYANSPITTSFIASFNAAMDQTENLENLFDMIWNVLSAQGYGLDVWGRIVGVNRTILFSGSAPDFGFQEAHSGTGFNQGPFFTGSSGVSNFVLDDTDFRRLILAKAAGNICDGSIPSINKILLALFPGRGAAYVADGLNMTLTYTLKFVATQVDLAIMNTPGVLPNPCGVVINISSNP